MKTPTLRSYSLLLGLVLASCLSPVQAQIPMATEYFPRQNKFEVYGIGEYLHQIDDADFGGGVKLKLDDTGMGGVGFAYHFNNFISAHADFLLGPATFRVEQPSLAFGGATVTSQLGHDSYISSGKFNIDYNIINRRLTPFITAGIGYQYMYINYDNYYYYSYYDETDFTWNVAGGIRWNITDNFFIKVYGGAQWLTYQDANNITTQIEASFALGWTFP